MTTYARVGAPGNRVYLPIDPSTRHLALDGLEGDAGTPSDSVEEQTDFGLSASAGISTDYARGDHSHGTPDEPESGGAAPVYIGKTTSGASELAGLTSAWAKKFTIPDGKAIRALQARLRMASAAGTSGFVAIYRDSAGAPTGVPIAFSSFGVYAAGGIVLSSSFGRIDFPIPCLPGAGDVWGVLQLTYQADSYRISYDSGGSDKEIISLYGIQFLDDIAHSSVSSAGRNYDLALLIDG